MDSPEKVTCEVKLRLSDVIHPFAYNWVNVINWVLIIFAGVLIFKPSSIYGPYPMEPWQDHVLYTSIAVAWMMFVGLPYSRLFVTLWKTPALKTPRRITLDADGMHLESEDARGDYKWSLFHSVRETKNAFVLKANAWSGTYIPKRCLTGPKDTLIIRKLMRENFKGKKTLRND
jgi:hypothetical protein